MIDTMLELARRAVACKGWRWMPGVLLVDVGEVRVGARIVVDADGVWARSGVYGDEGVDPDDALPDLTDPATLGCLLALVREAWVDPGVSAWRSDRADPAVWEIDASGGTSLRGPAFYRTEAEALVAAIEAAP